MPQRKIDLSRLFAIIFILISILYFYSFIFSPQHIPPILRVGIPSHPINLLILGTDAFYDKETGKTTSHEGNSDTIILASIDTIHQKINLISIPRDTLVDIPGYGKHKINAASLLGGGALTKKTVSNLFNIPIDYYVEIGFDGIPKIIDLLGGVYLYVDKDMYYQDRAGGLSINLKKGWQKLDGKKSHQFIRFRLDPTGDLARIKRQQYLVKTIFDHLSSPSQIIKLPLALNSINSIIKTDMPIPIIIRAVNFMRMINKQDLSFITLPGKPEDVKHYGSIWKLDPIEVSKTIKQNLPLHKNTNP